MKKDIFIGPLAFHINAIERLAAILNMESFEVPLDFEYIDYNVEISFCDRLQLKGIQIHNSDYFDIYQEENIEHRYYHQSYDGQDHYYAHASLSENTIRIEFYEGVKIFGRAFEIWQFLFLEKLLIGNEAFILHSSSVLWNGKAILFTAPSGTGKSTQADLWKRFENAEGINGDRNIVILHKGTWYCCGLPWHGSSTDCRNISAPIYCVALIRQYPEDMIIPLSALNKVKYLYSEITKNSWDIAFIEKSFDLIEKMTEDLKIVQLNCTMNKTAVICLKDFIEGRKWKY